MNQTILLDIPLNCIKLALIEINKIAMRKTTKVNTVRKPDSSMKPKIIGIAVKTPIWNRNCVFKAASRAVFCNTSALI